MDRKKVLAVIAAIALVAGCCLMMILYPLLKGDNLFQQEPSPEQVGEAFFQALQKEDYDAAFALCDERLQRELIDSTNLQFVIETYQYQPREWEFTTQRVSANQVELAGTMDFRLHSGGSFQLILRLYEDGWKVAVFHLDYN